MTNKISYSTTAFLRNESKENTIKISSTSTEEVFRTKGTLKDVTLYEGRVIVEGIVEKMFIERAGHHEASSSTCPSVDNFQLLGAGDKRLKHWDKSICDRRALERRIRLKTGKRTQEMLFNRHATVDNRDKKTVQRLMDFAERMNPVKLKEKRTDTLREYYDSEKCACVHELQETLPQAERDGATIVEISGLPIVTKYEIIGETAPQNKHLSKDKSKWINSQVLEESIECRRKDIERVIEFYPDIDNLHVVGKNKVDVISLHKKNRIECIENKELIEISGETSEEDNTLIHNVSVPAIIEKKVKTPQIALRINGQMFIKEVKTSSVVATWNVNFECEPYQRLSKEVLFVENVGLELLTFSWQKINFYPKHPSVNSGRKCFVFNYKNFILPSGCSRKITVMFQPRYTRVVKEKWFLRVFPKIFCDFNEYMVLTLIGKCHVPDEFERLTNKRQSRVIDKSNKRIMDKLTKTHGSLVPLIQPHEVVCPYERIFDEREIFNAQNKGYKCERFDDLEQLKALYKSLKKPRDHDWDLKLETMRKLILRQTDAKQREEAFTILMDILNDLMGCHSSLIDKFEQNDEKNRSRYIYVRGIIGNGIQEWEDLAILLEVNSMKLEMQRFNANLEENTEESEEDDKIKPWLRRLKYNNPEAFLLRNLQSSKHYRDSLYMLTYTHLCDIIENIVSVIESTEYV